MSTEVRSALWLVVTLLALGCGQAPPPAAGTGAREVVKGFYEAVAREDWPAAYAALHPDGRKRLGQQAFTRLAGRYRHDLGLEPREVFVRSCEEHGDEAVAHITLAGRAGSRHGQFRDSVTARRGPDGWGIVLPPTFGQPRPR